MHSFPLRAVDPGEEVRGRAMTRYADVLEENRNWSICVAGRNVGPREHRLNHSLHAVGALPVEPVPA